MLHVCMLWMRLACTRGLRIPKTYLRDMRRLRPRDASRTAIVFTDRRRTRHKNRSKRTIVIGDRATLDERIRENEKLPSEIGSVPDRAVQGNSRPAVGTFRKLCYSLSNILVVAVLVVTICLSSSALKRCMSSSVKLPDTSLASYTIKLR